MKEAAGQFAGLFNRYYEDPESLDGVDYPWFNIPEGPRDSALIGIEIR